jgi:hypothetical protein
VVVSTAEVGRAGAWLIGGRFRGEGDARASTKRDEARRSPKAAVFVRP